MGRPNLPLGTYGSIRVYELPDKQWRARTLYRDFDGVTRHVERRGKSKGGARNELTKALRDRARIDAAGIITPETRLSVVAEKWYDELTDLSPTTMAAYRDRLNKQVLPALGSVKVHELTIGLIDRHLDAVKRKHGAAIAKMTKSALSGICGLAARHDALHSNPVRDVARISTKPKRKPRAFSVDEVKAIRAWFESDKKSQDRDLPDLIAFLSATGVRIGEALAVHWEDVDLEEAIVEIRGTVIRIKAVGLIVKTPKTPDSNRILELPSWCIVMLKKRLEADASSGHVIGVNTGPVFCAPRRPGKLRDPNNTRRCIREAAESMGMKGEWTSHTFRKTLATMMDEAGLSARSASDQLGHSQVTTTMNTYYGRKRRPTGAAEVLEQLG